MTILEELIDYAEKCLNDVRISEDEDYMSCKAHKWACMRFLNDIERSSLNSCSFRWDEREAKLIVDWFRLLRHSKGVLAKKPIELTEWQKFNLCQIYGWRKRVTEGAGSRRVSQKSAEKTPSHRWRQE